MADVAPEAIKGLPAFEEFARKMKRLLTLVQRDEVDALLNCLYQAAERKMELERRRREIQEDDGRTMREKKRSMSQARNLLNQALQSLKRAKKDYSEALALVETSIINLESECYTLLDFIQFLEAAVECADKYQLVLAGLRS